MLNNDRFLWFGAGYPDAPAGLDKIQKVEHIERAIKEDICRRCPDLHPVVRLIPYLSLHEYEGLLFSDPEAFARSLGQPSLANRFRRIRDEFPTPEDINDDPQTALSKRVLAIYPAYRKPLEGTIAARAVGIERMRQECRHFKDWFEKLQALAK